MTLLQMAHARLRNPDTLFIVSDDGRNFTYGQFWNLAGKLAEALLGQPRTWLWEVAPSP